MKQFVKKKISFVMAMFMVMVTVISMSLPMSVFAQGGNTLTLNNNGNTSHDFEIYQIFTGDLAGDILSNIRWGTGIKENSKDSLGDAAETAKTLTNASTAETFAKAIQEHLEVANKKEVTVASKGAVTVTDLDAGYYLIKDEAQSQTGENAAYTAYILKVVGNTTATAKLDVPTLVKKVQENSNQQWQDAADYSIEEVIPYKLTSTLPNNYDKYETYFYEFNDKMSEGLTFDQTSVKVKADNILLTAGQDYTLEVDEVNNSFQVRFENLKAIQNPTITSESQIVVEYECKLNQNAVIGGNGNPNTAYLKYSNNPNQSGEGDYGTTPEDKNIVFTYKVVVNKKNENSQPLGGAEFTLYKKNESSEELIGGFVISGSLQEVFTLKGLDAGKYVLKETKTPLGYNTIEPIIFTITASYDTVSDDPKLTALTGQAEGTETITFTPNKDEGSLSTDVINNKGVVLPETGGMGRYLIYTLGTIFVLASLGYVGYKRSRKHSER